MQPDENEPEKVYNEHGEDITGVDFSQDPFFNNDGKPVNMTQEQYDEWFKTQGAKNEQ